MQQQQQQRLLMGQQRELTLRAGRAEGVDLEVFNWHIHVGFLESHLCLYLIFYKGYWKNYNSFAFVNIFLRHREVVC